MRDGSREPETTLKPKRGGFIVFYRVMDRGTGPTRLFIGGVHGKEGLTTIKALKMVSEHPLNDGKLILINCPASEYISTLKGEYYTSRTGKGVLSLIKKYNPDIYLELHCYRKENYNKLIDTERRYKDGVPPLIELENKVLIGSISPLVRITFFEKYDFPFMLEMPCDPSADSMGTCLDVLNMVAGSKNRPEILKKLEYKYPSAVKKAREYFLEFSGNFVKLFKEMQIELMKDNDLRNFQTNRDAIIKKASQMNLSITLKQAELILQAFLLYKEYYPDFRPDSSWVSVG